MISAWWKQDDFGVGIACGPADLVVLDVDAHSVTVPPRERLLPGIPIPAQVNLDGLATGHDTLALLAAYRGHANPAHDETTLRVRTPSGGLHIWYRNPQPAQHYRSSTGSSTRMALAWQVDIRAHAGYVVAPATSTPSGRYELLGDVADPAPLPDWLAQELRRTGHLPQNPVVPPARRRTVPRARGTGAQAVLRALLAEVESCAAVPEGAAFTEKLNKAAWTAGGLSAVGHMTHDDARAQLLQAAQQARPHQIRRNESIIDAGLRAGTARPFHLKGTRS